MLLRNVRHGRHQITLPVSKNSRDLVFQRWINPRARALTMAVMRLLHSSFLKIFRMCASTVWMLMFKLSAMVASLLPWAASDKISRSFSVGRIGAAGGTLAMCLAEREMMAVGADGINIAVEGVVRFDGRQNISNRLHGRMRMPGRYYKPASSPDEAEPLLLMNQIAGMSFTQHAKPSGWRIKRIDRSNVLSITPSSRRIIMDEEAQMAPDVYVPSCENRPVEAVAA